MKNHFISYLDQIEANSELSQSLNNTIGSIVPKYIKDFSCKEHLVGLLLGNVQSGKTGQIFGLISEAANEGFQIFILLTTDNVYLQQQTFARALSSLDTFNVCGESDDLRFLQGGLRKPILIVLKKNTNILKTWKNHLISSKYCQGQPIFIVDDEADAASLNTKINKNEQSTINSHLEDIKNLSSSSIYIQVTATPQALLLQSKISGWKPSFIHYFEPGKNYLGGDFFYSEPRSFVIRLTAENELGALRNNDFIPEGLRTSLITFLVTAAHMKLSGARACNFLIHPSVRIDDHEVVADSIGGYLNLLLSSFAEEEMKQQLETDLHNAWLDIHATKPDIKDFVDILACIEQILDSQGLNIIVMNSKNPQGIDVTSGLNIIVGGNSLGRGVTFPSLQTVYYCRKSKSPQADTFWQHCRMFGYDRDPGLMRIFIPPLLLKLFTNLNNSNRALIEQIRTAGIDELTLLYSAGIKPTRKNVLDLSRVDIIAGGVNFFPNYPTRKNFDKVEKLLNSYADDKNYHDISIDEAIEILEQTHSESKEDWDNKEFVNCLKAIKSTKERVSKNVKLIVRRGRDISKGTGTLLSPNDRQLGDRVLDDTVLTMYRLNGDKSKGWQGQPLWVPNIKLPKLTNFYKS